MRVTHKGLKILLKATANAADEELTCEESAARVHRYVEHRLHGGTTPLPADLAAVHQHLSVCHECVEVVDAILASLRAEEESEDSR